MAGADKKTLISKLLSDPDAGGVKKTKRTPKSAKITFAAAMDELGYTSVFDIVRESKSTFVTRLAARTDADGHLAYDNAQCYAAQIARSWREHQVSSDRRQITTARTGIRSLVDVGPSFPNLFKENWDQFCKVGAIAAVDSPVAYLNSLYSFLLREIEGQGGPDAIPLSVRRPDIPSLVLDAQSTFTPVPMLKLVTEVLSKGIQEYLDAADHDDKDTPVHELLKTKRHPFTFPYDFHHQQIMLGLSGKKQPTLGELSYRASQFLPIYGNEANQDYGAIVSPDVPSFNAQCLLSGLSAEQQRIVVSEMLFKTFYVSRSSLERSGITYLWRTSSFHLLTPWISDAPRAAFILPEQPEIVSVSPPADSLLTTTPAGPNNALITAFSSEDDVGISFYSFDRDGFSVEYLKMNNARYPENCLVLAVDKWKDHPLLDEGIVNFRVLYESESSIDGVSNRTHGVECSISISMSTEQPEDYPLSPVQRSYFLDHYGLDVPSCATNPLLTAKTFMAQTGLTADQLSAVLSQDKNYPTFSPNVARAVHWGDKFPLAMNYGACYVNGIGGWEVGSLPVVRTQTSDPSMGIEVDGSASNGSVTSYLTNTSLNRFDRLQRMIRLQRWMNIPFAELDTLIMAVIHSEGESNLTWELNGNTLRALGVYRYLSNRYVIKPEEFAAFMHFLTAFASGERMPLFDQVFNSPARFDTPLVLDGATFSYHDPASQKTIAQLCAGLELANTEDELGLVMRDTALFLGPADNKGKPVEIELSRRQVVISSIYRQVRIAKMLGLTVKESRCVITMLGGDTYLKRVVTGAVRGAMEDEVSSDILDILMQMDWCVTWMKDSETDIFALKEVAADPLSSPVSQSMLDRIDEAINDLKNVLLTRDHVVALHLPAALNEASEEVDWWGDVVNNRNLVTSEGVVAPNPHFPPLRLSDPVGYFSELLKGMDLGAITFTGEVDQDEMLEKVITELAGFLATTRATQLKILEVFYQTAAKIPMELTELAIRYSYFVGHGEAVLTYFSVGNKEVILQLVNKHSACSTLLQKLAIAASTLQAFLEHPDRLFSSAPTNLRLTLATFYYLDRYGHWVRESGLHEDLLLAYFFAADEATADDRNEMLSQLINWPASEIAAVLPTGASTMAEVDWVRRVQAACTESGLPAASLLTCTQLNSQSTSADWQAVAEAVMAANH